MKCKKVPYSKTHKEEQHMFLVWANMQGKATAEYMDHNVQHS